MRVASNHRVPGDQVFEGHGVKQTPGFSDSAVLREGGDHGVVGYCVAAGHCVEHSDGFFDSAGFCELGQLQILGEDLGSLACHGFEMGAHI